jgi:hypothetical protein
LAADQEQAQPDRRCYPRLHGMSLCRGSQAVNVRQVRSSHIAKSPPRPFFNIP